jgi:hypothetical protein
MSMQKRGEFLHLERQFNLSHFGVNSTEPLRLKDRSYRIHHKCGRRIEPWIINLNIYVSVCVCSHLCMENQHSDKIISIKG